MVIIKRLVFIFAGIILGSHLYAGWNSEFIIDDFTDQESLLIYSDKTDALILCTSSEKTGRKEIGVVFLTEQFLFEKSFQAQYRFDKDPAYDGITLAKFRDNGAGLVIDIEKYLTPGYELSLRIEQVRFVWDMFSKNRLLLRFQDRNQSINLEVDLTGLSQLPNLRDKLTYCGLL